VSIGTPEQNAKFFAELPGALEGLVTFNHVDLSLGGTGSRPSVTAGQEAAAPASDTNAVEIAASTATPTPTDGQEPVPPVSDASVNEPGAGPAPATY
ncbi:MAG TPA: hypothetical protein VHY09_10220, partial [Candidatus Methylacidiphilales bacterium]|nr:hypothetical protein [Candidatus Methylacidiphilales bacterium]